MNMKVRKSKFGPQVIGGKVEYDGLMYRITGEGSSLLRGDFWILERVYEVSESQPSRIGRPDGCCERDSEDVVTPAAVGYATGSAILGEIAGGSFLGGMAGAAMSEEENSNRSSAPTVSDPEPNPASDPSPVLESPDPDPTPASDPTADFSPSPDPSSSDNSSVA